MNRLDPDPVRFALDPAHRETLPAASPNALRAAAMMRNSAR